MQLENPWNPSNPQIRDYVWKELSIYLTFALVKEATEGNEIVPFFIFRMQNETTVGLITSMLQSILDAEPSYFLVEVRIKPTNNIKVFLDGDSGITIEKCVQFNRALYKKIEEANIFPQGDFSLEISSPGLDEPLKLKRQYAKNIGRKVEIVLVDGTKKEGNLQHVSEDGIILEEITGKNRNRQSNNNTYLFNNIKTTKIQAVF